MSLPSYARTLVNGTKRLKLSPQPNAQCQPRVAQPFPRCTVAGSQQRRYDSTVVEASRQLDETAGAAETTPASLISSTSNKPANIEQELAAIRLPRAVQATYLDPLRHKTTHNIKMAEIQIRSYSVRNLEVFADFCMRAAYYLNLPAKGPIALPRITERWTVPRSNFVHKKSQENFERITVRRGIKVFDGHPETVAAWLAFIRKHQYYGVGMKANVFDYGTLSTSADMDAEAERIAKKLGEQLDLVGGKKSLMVKGENKVRRMLDQEPFKARWGAYAAMGGAQSVPSAGRRVDSVMVGEVERKKRDVEAEKTGEE